MISTHPYRGRRLSARSVEAAEQQVPGENQWGDRYLPTVTYNLGGFEIASVDGGHPLVAFPKLRLATRSDRFGSWAAWDACGFFALLGDFVLYVETASEVQDPTDGVFTLERVSLVDPATLDPATDGWERRLLPVQAYDGLPDERRRSRLEDEFVSISHAHAYSALREHLSGTARTPVEIPLPGEGLRSCGGAALLTIDGALRWLLPHPGGVSKALEHARATSLADDWRALAPIVASLDAAERKRVAALVTRLGLEGAGAAGLAA